MTIAYAWGLESQVKSLDPLLLGGKLNLACCFQMMIFILQGGRVFTSHHGKSLFPMHPKSH